MKKPKPLVALSFAVAAAGFLVGPANFLFLSKGNEVPLSGTVSLSIWIAWLWIATTVLAVTWHEKKGLWALPAAPFVLYWPAMWIWFARACSIFGCF